MHDTATENKSDYYPIEKAALMARSNTESSIHANMNEIDVCNDRFNDLLAKLEDKLNAVLFSTPVNPNDPGDTMPVREMSNLGSRLNDLQAAYNHRLNRLSDLLNRIEL